MPNFEMNMSEVLRALEQLILPPMNYVEASEAELVGRNNQLKKLKDRIREEQARVNAVMNLRLGEREFKRKVASFSDADLKKLEQMVKAGNLPSREALGGVRSLR